MKPRGLFALLRAFFTLAAVFALPSSYAQSGRSYPGESQDLIGLATVT